MKDTFSEYHPFINFIYFALMIGFALALTHPLAQGISLAIFGAISTVLIFGGIMNPASLFIFSPQSVNLKTLLTHYLTGLPMDTVHALSTVVFITLAAKPMLRKLERIKVKYGLVEPL